MIRDDEDAAGFPAGPGDSAPRKRCRPIQIVIVFQSIFFQLFQQFFFLVALQHQTFDQDEARDAVRTGKIMPLTAILEIVTKREPGTVMEVELETKNGKLTYRIEVLNDKGRRREIGWMRAAARCLGGGRLMRALVVEDSPDVAEHVAEALVAAGFVVDQARDGEDAWFRGDTENYDAVILDLGLPKLDGLSVLKRWRGADRLFPVLILSARGDWVEKVEGIEAGADDYLGKPFEMGELVARVRGWCAAPRAAAPASCGSAPCRWTLYAWPPA
jgi:CheY-like chemotaxis protein